MSDARPFMLAAILLLAVACAPLRSTNSDHDSGSESSSAAPSTRDSEAELAASSTQLRIEAMFQPPATGQVRFPSNPPYAPIVFSGDVGGPSTLPTGYSSTGTYDLWVLEFNVDDELLGTPYRFKYSATDVNLSTPIPFAYTHVPANPGVERVRIVASMRLVALDASNHKRFHAVRSRAIDRGTMEASPIRLKLVFGGADPFDSVVSAAQK